MTKLKEIRESAPKWMTTSLFDILIEMDPSETNKFVPMMVSIINNEEKQLLDSNWSNEDERESFMSEIKSIIPSKFSRLSFEDMFPLFKLMDSQAFSTTIFADIQDFMDLYQKKYMSGVDVSQIKNFNQLTTHLSLATVKQNLKEFEKQINKMYEDENWLLVRPITYESSLKYGAGTRWCTAAKTSPDHFFRYAENGVLIYCLNKNTGYKVAVFKSLYERETSFWNSADLRVDSMETELDGNVLNVLKNELKHETMVSNRELDNGLFEESRNINMGYKQKKRYEELSVVTPEEYEEPSPVNEAQVARAGVMVR
mgnify:FL=1